MSIGDGGTNLDNELLLLSPNNKATLQTLRFGTFVGKLEKEFKSWLIDIKFIDNEYLLVTDARYKKLKKFCFRGQLKNEVSFSNRPMFFVYFDDRMTFVTTFAHENIIRIVNSVNQLEVIAELTVTIGCSGIANIGKTKFALACRPKRKINIMSGNGTKLRKIKPLIDEANDSEEEGDNRGQHHMAGRKDFDALKRHRQSLKVANIQSRLVWAGYIDASETQIYVTDYETSLLTIIYIENEACFRHKSIPLVDSRECDLPGYDYDISLRTCLKFNSTQLNWYDARQQCIDEGGDLITVETVEKLSFHNTSLHNCSTSQFYWIGLINGTWTSGELFQNIYDLGPTDIHIAPIFPKICGRLRFSPGTVNMIGERKSTLVNLLESRIEKAIQRHKKTVKYFSSGTCNLSHNDGKFIELGHGGCIASRDFQPRKCIFENIIDCMQKNSKVILVLTKNFVYSDWCQFEANQALLELMKPKKKMKCVIPLLLAVEEHEIPSKLKDITYADFTNDEDCMDEIVKLKKVLSLG
ncbi:unnamed protein product [Mytilus coruscus]|uniref:TIR domain-containing protein n=1 Tax=Mytilus coruscus TaxID=42192 RepID=A0A6J8ADU9_MYTCO|nr:unnamed protein product [Mytilus coruscus]